MSDGFALDSVEEFLPVLLGLGVDSLDFFFQFVLSHLGMRGLSLEDVLELVVESGGHSSQGQIVPSLLIGPLEFLTDLLKGDVVGTRCGGFVLEAFLDLAVLVHGRTQFHGEGNGVGNLLLIFQHWR